jgi:hypothetical protein
VPNYLTPDKELILAELGVKKCEPLDIIIAKAKGRGSGVSGGKRKRSSDVGSSDDSGSADSSNSARDGETADKSDCGGDYVVEDEDDQEDAEGPIAKKRRRRSAPEPRETKKTKKEEDDDKDRQLGQTVGSEVDAGLRRSGRRRKPLFDLEHLDLVQRQHLYDHNHQHQTRGRTKRALTTTTTTTRSTETSPLPPDGNDE